MLVDTEQMEDHTPAELMEGEFEVSEAMSFLSDIGVMYDYADDYGEPGYSLDKEGGFFVIGDWWCNDKGCDYPDKYPEDSRYNAGEPKCHGVALHYKALFEKLEEEGMETAFYDEWTVVDGVQVGEYPNIEIHNLAYRTNSDSFSWQSSILWDEEQDCYLTPHDGIAAWIEVHLRNGTGISGRWNEADLEEQGFEEYNCNYESGWFEGMNDDPSKIMKALVERMGETHDILPYLKESSMFYFKFCVFTREKNTCANCATVIEDGEPLCDNCNERLN